MFDISNAFVSPTVGCNVSNDQVLSVEIAIPRIGLKIENPVDVGDLQAIDSHIVHAGHNAERIAVEIDDPVVQDLNVLIENELVVADPDGVGFAVCIA